MATTRWLVILKGDVRSLEALANDLTQPPATVERIGQYFYLRSTVFETMSDPGSVEQYATDLVAAANAAVSIETTAFHPSVEIVAAVRHEEGSPIPIVLKPDPVVLEIALLRPTVLISGAPVHRTSDRIASRVGLALTNRDVAEAFSYLDHPDLSWPDLYKVAEVVQRSVGGPHELRKRHWVEPNEFGRFRQTANHFRHAKNATQYPLPTPPMTLSRAKKYLKEVVDTWLREEHDV